MEIGNNKIETIDGKMLWTPKEPIEYIKTTIPTIPADVDISAKLDELLGKPTLIEELTKLVIKDEQERYIRELLIRNKELQAEIEEANENASWWKSRYEGVRKIMDTKETVDHIRLTPSNRPLVDMVNEDLLYKHRLDTANEYIESRKEHMMPEHYNDLKYILNECDLESSW